MKKNHGFSYHSIVNANTFLEEKTDGISYIGTKNKNDQGFHKFTGNEADRARRDMQEHLSAVLFLK